MKCCGIDVGSRYIKFVILEEGEVLHFSRIETGAEPLPLCTEFLRQWNPDRLIATGYGRHLLEVHGNYPAITEIKAVALGASHIFPGCRTIVDIGGQDTKAVRLNDKCSVSAFEMNDRCAAGTGKFLEIMAHTLGYRVEEFGSACVDQDESIKINSMCTVFAESEVIGLIARGLDRPAIASALHQSVVDRVVSLVQRVGVENEVVFAGGCARNVCLQELLSKRLGKKLSIHRDPDMLAALGAALHAGRQQG